MRLIPAPLSQRAFAACLVAAACSVSIGCGRSNVSTAPVHALAPAEVKHAIFDNVAASSGISLPPEDVNRPLSILDSTGCGVALLDADGDGLLDIVFIGKGYVKLFRNLGGFTFSDVTAVSGLQQDGYWFGAAVGDYDNDGRTDLYICGYNSSALYHNRGGCRFDLVRQSGLDVRPPSPDGVPEWRSAAGFIDVDGDGLLDLVIGRYVNFGPKLPQLCGDPTRIEQYTCAPDIYVPQQTSIYRNTGKGRFADISDVAGMKTSSGRTLGIAFGDFNNDGKMDIAIANDERPGDLFLNLGGGGFANRGVDSGTALSMMGKVHGGMGVDWGDFDNDGKLDLFVATYQNEAKNLYHNLGKGVFMDVSLDAGISEKMDQWVAFGAKFLDYDRDGSLDLIVANGHVVSNTAKIHPGTSFQQPIQLFHNLNGKFEETTGQMSDSARKWVVGRGLAVGDLDNDGKPDVVVVDRAGQPALLRNTSDDHNHWISLKLAGTKSNRDGFGARVTVRAGGKSQIKDCTNAGSFASANDPRLLFGVGSASEITIEVRWPSGSHQMVERIPADKLYEVREGAKSATPITPH